MDRIDAMRAFVEVVRAGGFSHAAASIGVSQATVSKRVASLEKGLGVSLLVRHATGVSLTDRGKAYFQRCQAILADVEAAHAEVMSDVGTERSILHITMSPVLARLVIAPVIMEYLKRYPRTNVTARLTEDHLDLAETGIDLAIRATRNENRTLEAVTLFENPMIAAASADYLEAAGVPAHPDDLTDHRCLAFSRMDDGITWQFSRTGENVRVAVKGPFRCDQGDSLVAMATLGAGIVVMPRWVMAEELDKGTLVRVLPDWTAGPLPLQAVYPRQRRLPLKTRRFLDLLRDRIPSGVLGRDD